MGAMVERAKEFSPRLSGTLSLGFAGESGPGHKPRTQSPLRLRVRPGGAWELLLCHKRDLRKIRTLLYTPQMNPLEAPKEEHHEKLDDFVLAEAAGSDQTGAKA